MISVELIYAVLNPEANTNPYQSGNLDYVELAISHLRSVVPVAEVPKVITSTHDGILCLIDLDKTAYFISESDLAVLANCKCIVDEETHTVAIAL